MHPTVAQSPPALAFLPAPARPLFWRIPGLPVRIPCSTQYRFGACAAAILACGVLLFFAGASAIRQSRSAFKSVGLDCAPSIVAAQGIRTDLADLDANYFNQLLRGPATPEGLAARKIAADRHRQVSEKLVVAAKNITFGADEQIPIVTMVSGLGSYESTMATALAMQRNGDTAAALAVARQAAKFMRDVILPAADALDRANTAVLDKTYADHQETSDLALGGLLLSGVLLLGAFLFAQIYLTRRTHRFLNVGLLVATVIGLLIVGETVIQAVNAGRQLRTAVDDAFASVHLLWQARALGYDANGEESRYLFDHEKAAAYEQAFRARAAEIAASPSGAPLQSMAAIANTRTILPSDFTGLLARELGNITFPGERDAAVESVNTFAVYLSVDEQIRALEKDGHHDEAIALCLSDAPGGSNRAFADFDAAVGKTIAINQREFDRAIKEGFDTLAGAEWTIAACVLLIAACTLAGYWPRLKEYA